MTAPRSILCATDLSPASAPTIRYALSLAAEFECKLVLLHVLEGLATLDNAVYAHQPPAVAVPSQQEAVARQQLRQAVDTDARAWCSIEERIVPGRPYEEILRVAAQVSADLIVMGGRHQPPLVRTFLASTSRSVVRAASCPVLTVRAAPTAGALDLQEDALAAEVRS